MLPPEAALVGGVNIPDASKLDSPAATQLYTRAIDCSDPDGCTRVAIEVDEGGVKDAQAVVQRRDDASVRTVLLS